MNLDMEVAKICDKVNTMLIQCTKYDLCINSCKNKQFIIVVHDRLYIPLGDPRLDLGLFIQIFKDGDAPALWDVLNQLIPLAIHYYGEPVTKISILPEIKNIMEKLEIIIKPRTV